MNTKTQIAVIVIPTYNEAENIGKMIEYLNDNTFPQLSPSWDMKILVVDGNSPDGTSNLVTKYSQKYKNTYLLTETSKDGLGAAYFKGFKYAMDTLQADFVFEFDADFQHPPETIPSMLQAMTDGYDYVIGSRKIKGGGEPAGRDLKRMLLTEIGGFAARFILFFPFKHFFDVTDPTTGLKVTRVKGYLDKMNLDYGRLYSQKFGYKVQLLLETLDMGAKFKEVPLQFQNRESGQSKFEPDTSQEILWSCLQSRWHQPLIRKFMKFGTVGFIGYLINATGLSFFSHLWKIEWLSWFLSTELAIISNFTLNNLWTFKSNQVKGSSLVGKFLQFNFTSAGALLIQTIFGTLAVTFFGENLRQLYLPIIIVFFVLPYNWIMYNKVIWKKK